MDIPLFFFILIVFLYSVIIHEVSHGVIANLLGDPTAKTLGRLTLNPLSHIDPFGSIILPLLLLVPMLFGAPTIIFGWAKPVPYDPRYLKNPIRDAALIAGIGPVSNLIIASILGIIMRFDQFDPLFQSLLGRVVWINILLGVFNLVPIFPLDGSKILTALFPESGRKLLSIMEQYGFIILILFILFGFQFITPIMLWIYKILTGTYPGF